MSFTQIIEIDGIRDEQQLRELVAGWDEEQAGTAPGYLGSRVFAEEDAPGRYLVEVDFSSADEAKRNNDRDETARWAERLRDLADGEPNYRNLRRAYATSN